MSKVLEFKRPRSGLVEELEKNIGNMEELYAAYDRLQGVMLDLEEKIDLEEFFFNQKLMKYKNEVGADNVPIRYLNYSTEILVIQTEDGFEFLWADENEDEE